MGPFTVTGVNTMKILIVYATKSGCTEDIARRIGTTLRALGGDVRVIPAESAPSPDGFDAVIVGSGVRAGKWHKAATGWVSKHAGAIRRRPLAMFTCCLTMRDGQKKAAEVLAYTQPILKSTALTPAGIGLFAGWFEPEHFGFMERTILKMMKAPQGDFRDFAAVDAWTEDIAPRLGLLIPVRMDLRDDETVDPA